MLSRSFLDEKFFICEDFLRLYVWKRVDNGDDYIKICYGIASCKFNMDKLHSHPKYIHHDLLLCRKIENPFQFFEDNSQSLNDPFYKGQSIQWILNQMARVFLL